MRKIAVVGLGYVGLPLAVELGQKTQVIAFDINKEKVETLKKGYDFTNTLEKSVVHPNIHFTHREVDLKFADFYIIAVPTPISNAHTPDLQFLLSASNLVAKYLKFGDIIVYESTVYPGVTEDICLPILEEVSGLKSIKDFCIGYSPERINPGDKQHTLDNIIKVIAAQTSQGLDIIEQIYGTVVSAGVKRVSSIRVAEAAKVIENTQRDINIAFMNEICKIFYKMQIPIEEVLEAAGTKWNFIKMHPGLVGGHCIGVDPYYLAYAAHQIGVLPEIITAGRRINDNMPMFFASEVIKYAMNHNIDIVHGTIGILGVTFKKNCGDVRNSKVFALVKELQSFGVRVVLHDPLADVLAVKQEYGFTLTELAVVLSSRICILAVEHEWYFENLNTDMVQKDVVLLEVARMKFSNIKKFIAHNCMTRYTEEALC